MKGEDLGKDWGNDATPIGGDLGADWGNDAVPEPAAPVVQKPPATWLQALAPANVQAQSQGAGRIGKTYGALKDLLTAPGRLAFAATQGAGELAGSRDIGQAVDAFKGAAADPVGSFQQVQGYMPPAQRFANPKAFAEMAADPLVLPGAALGVSSLNPIAQGLLGSVAAYAKRQADARVNGAETDLGMNRGEIIPTLASAGAAALPVVGGSMQNTGNEMFRKMVKPARDEVEGFLEALAAGKLPQLAGWAGTVGGAGEQFLRRLGKIGEKYPEILDPADALAKAGGEKISTFQAWKAADDALNKAQLEGYQTLSPEEINAASNWLRKRIHLPNTEEGLKAVRNRPNSWPANDVLPSKAHRQKSSFYDMAFDKNADAVVPLAGKIRAAKAASKNLRSQLNEISPEYAALNREAAPLYAAEDAMSRAAEVRGNNLHLNALDILGFPIAMRTPAVARGVWETGRAAQALAPLAKRLAPILATPGDQTNFGNR